MYIRQSYLNHLLKHKDKDYIKVITGIRRAGKSTLMRQYQEALKSLGVSDRQIISLNLEDFENQKLTNVEMLNQEILNRMTDDCPYYLFLDEIQMVSDFEKALNSLNLRENLDIYITGSNAYMLSGELATLLSGRYVEISVLPFSFKEYFDYLGGDSRAQFRQYLAHGGFPYAIKLDDEEAYKDYIEGIVNTVIVKDIMGRKKITDSLLLESVAKFLFSNVGSLINVKKIVDTLTSANRKTSSPTVENYLKSILDALIAYKVDRYDIWGKRYLQLNSKYYLADLALKNAYLGKRRSDIGHDLENIVFIELKRRGYEISIGNINKLEVDFIAQKSGEKLYLQVSASVLDPTTFQREIAPLKAIDDNFPKLLLTLDEISMGEDGINQVNLIDWLID